MKFLSFLRDKLISICIYVFVYVVVILLFFAFKVDVSLMIAFSFLYILSNIIVLMFEYYSRKRFYDELVYNVKVLDKAYLVLETLREPSFYEGKIVYNSMYEINKSMNENVKELSRQINDFKDYIEMWIHEVKIPLASCILKVHNNKDKFSDDMMLQLKRVDDYLEQVLYYVRSENASKDYLIGKVRLDKCINNVLVRNKDYLLESIETALVTAYKRNFDSLENVKVQMDQQTGATHVFSLKEVVKRVMDKETQINIKDAQKINPDFKEGDTVEMEIVPRDFGRIAAQTAKQVIIQKLREAEREIIYTEFNDRKGEIVSRIGTKSRS